MPDLSDPYNSISYYAQTACKSLLLTPLQTVKPEDLQISPPSFFINSFRKHNFQKTN